MMKLLEKLEKALKKLIDDGVKVNIFDEMKEETYTKDHIQDLKDQGINVRINEYQINDLIKRNT